MMPWNHSLLTFFGFFISICLHFRFFWNLLPFLYFFISYGFFVFFFPYFSPMQPTTSPAIATNNVHLFNVLLIKYPHTFNPGDPVPTYYTQFPSLHRLPPYPSLHTLSPTIHSNSVHAHVQV